METSSTYNLRKNALIRGLFPGAIRDAPAPPPLVEGNSSSTDDLPTSALIGGAQEIRIPKRQTEQKQSTALIIRSATGGAASGGADTAAETQPNPVSRAKRPRETEGAAGSSSSTAIIPMDPEMLKNASEEAKRKEVEEQLATKPQWKLKRVLAGHEGRVRAVCVEPQGQWVASGGADSFVKVWDLATGQNKVDLVGHKDTVRGIAISSLSPYMFTCGEDHAVYNWDLERNTKIRDFHGHLGAVYTVNTHPSQDNIIITGSRDATVRVWDIRSRKDVFRWEGHTKSVLCTAVQRSEPQIISGGDDGFIYLWDLVAGKAMNRLTRHKKAVRALVPHPRENTMVSIGADEIRKWKLPEGDFFCNLKTMPNSPGALWCCGSVSPTSDVLFTGSEDGGMRFYDYPSHTMYQGMATKNAPGTIPGEGGIMCATFDVTGTRLITGEGDKMIKIWQEAK